MKKLSLILCLTITACSSTGIPDGVKAIDGFEIKRYLGTWYEIARLDHPFERGLSNVSATYTPKDDGGINVLNKGYNKAEGEWEQAEGKAYLLDNRGEGRLRVTFFWPFYAAYNIIALDKENYSHALICGPDKSYLWILSRDKILNKQSLKKLLGLADQLGFPVNELIMVEHDIE